MRSSIKSVLLDSPRALVALSFAATSAACGVADAPPAQSDIVGETCSPITGDGAVSRARTWVDAGMPYCGATNGGNDLICGGTCVRPSAARSPDWDHYRSDCSGLVSYALGLPAPGILARQFDDVSTPINGRDLRPGDVLQQGDGKHVVLFSGWIDRDRGRATIIQEGSCGGSAEEMNVTISPQSGSTVKLWGVTYNALRYDGVDCSGF